MSVIDYLNDKTNKQFKASSKATARLGERAFLVKATQWQTFKKVIDTKVKAWEMIRVGRSIYGRPPCSMRRILKTIWRNREVIDCPVKHVRQSRSN